MAGAASSEAAAALPVYDADVLTGQAHRTNGRIVGVMVNNISNSERQNARPQRGIGSADILIESKVEGGIPRPRTMQPLHWKPPQSQPHAHDAAIGSITTTARASSAPSLSMYINILA